MDIQQLLTNYGVLAYGIAIFFGGRWGLQYFTYFKQAKYNFLVFATVIGVLFNIGEVIAHTITWANFGKYLITYTVVTSCYEMVADLFPFLKPKNPN